MSCTVVLRSGKYKGQVCGQTDRVCTHTNITCKNCKGTYTYKDSYDNHLRWCKIPVTVKLRKSNTDPPAPNIVINNVSNTVQHNTINNINNTINNTLNLNVYIGDNIYAELKALHGGSGALKCIEDMVTKKDPVALIETLYFKDKDPNQTPIACRNIVGNRIQMRYITKDGIVDDIGGHKTARMLENRNKDALIYASNDIIASCQVDTDDTDDKLLKLNRTQIYATEQSTPKNHKVIIHRLKELATNENHSFYTPANNTYFIKE